MVAARDVLFEQEFEIITKKEIDLDVKFWPQAVKSLSTSSSWWSP